MGRTCSSLLVATFVCVLAAPAAAQRSTACQELAAKNDLEPRVGTLMSLGACLEASQKLASASARFADAQHLAASSGDAKAEAQARAKVDALAPRLSSITIVVSPEATIPDLVVTRNGELINAAQWNTATPVDGGTYNFVAYGRGTDEWSLSVTIANEADLKQVTIPVLTSAKPPVTDVPTSAAPPADTSPVAMAPLPAPGQETDTKAPGLAPRTWYAIAGACVVAGVVIDLGVSSSKNGSWDAMDFVPLALYGAGLGIVYKERF
jgi:hypothetical protein